jgi:hypothetical protein
VLLLFCTTFSSNAQYVETEQCIGGEGQDLYLFSYPTHDGGKLVGVSTNSTTGDFMAPNSNNFTVAFIKLNATNEMEWKSTHTDENFNINGFQQSVCQVIEDEELFFIYRYGQSNEMLLLDKHGNFIRKATLPIPAERMSGGF